MDPIFVIYGFLLVLSLINYLLILRRLRAKKEVIGNIRSKWSSRFNLEFPLNWAVWGFVVLYLAGSLYFIATLPYQNNDWTLLVILFLFLSFYPKWNVYVGTKGILWGTRMYLWEKVEKSSVVEKGKYTYLILKYPSREKRIPVPSKYRETLDKIKKERGF
ncbi:hypothetical protein KGY73_08325 [bacterium]|nr:hypothetical protein [bacterium]